MIDTIKFKIPITKEIQQQLLKIGTQYSKIDHGLGFTEYNVYRYEMNLPSSAYGLNFTLKDYNDEFVFLELSIPKYYFGHNIYLLYPSELTLVLLDLFTDISHILPNFPTPNLWEVQRLDICYSWKYEDQKTACFVLDYLHSFAFSRKRKFSYDSSVMYSGSSYSVKFYLKRPEYYKNDFRKLLKLGYTEEAYKWLNFADGVLRYEVSMRRKHLQQIFKKSIIYYTDLTDNDTITALLQQYMQKFIKGYSNESLSSLEVIDRLKAIYKYEKAIRLWAFWRIYMDVSQVDRKIYEDHHFRSTIWRNRRDLEKAGIGLKRFDNYYKYDLSIPSTYVSRYAPDASRGESL